MNWRDLLGHLNSLVSSRASIQAKTGQTFGGSRNNYEIFGWPISPGYDQYYFLYRRGGIAKRIVMAYPQATWRTPPDVREESKNKEDTQFEVAWKEFAEKRKVFHYLERVHRLARLGTFSVLFMGLSDIKSYEELANPVGALKGSNPWDKLLYLQPYAEDVTSVNQWDEDPASPRFGLPKVYQIQLNQPSLGGLTIANRTVLVHHTRIIHVAEDLMESDIEGYPALEPVMNMLLDLEKVCGAASEAFFQETPPATLFNASPDAQIDTTDDATKEMIEDFVHKYKRFLMLQGIDVTKLDTSFGDPSKIADILLQLIAGTTGIPNRILVGSERGELASSQDETAWNKRVEECQQNWAEPFLLRPFIDVMIGMGVIPGPVGGKKYLVEWKDSEALSEIATADIGVKQADTLSKYVSAMGADEVVPPDIFLEMIMKFPVEVIDRIKETRQDIWDKELEDALKDDETLAKEELKKREILGEGLNKPPVAAPVAAPGGNKPPTVSMNPYHDRLGRFSHGGGGGIAVERGADGKWVRKDGKELDEHQISVLKKVMPAWTDVRINGDREAALQAKGIDKKGREQPVYSAKHTAKADAEKFARAKEFNQRVPEIRKNYEADFAAGGKKAEHAAVLKLIDQTGFRPGSNANTRANVQAFGATNLRAEHTSISGSKITFSFPGKKGVQQNHTIEDAALAKFLKPRVEAGGKLFNTSDTAVRNYFHSIGGRGFLVKDFRTRVGTNTALTLVSKMSVPKTAKEYKESVSAVAKQVSARLGNTPAMALKAYIDPGVFHRWNGGKAMSA